MNAGAPGGQPPQGQPSGDQQQQQPPKPKFTIFKPEQMRNLPAMFSDAEKEKYEIGLRNFWNQLENNPENTPLHTQAKQKLFEFSKTLTNKIQAYRMQQQQAAQKGQPAGARPAGQGQQPQQSQQEGSGGNQNAGPQAPRPGPQVSKKLMDHINSFPFTLPPNLVQGTPEANKYLNDQKGRYLKGLHAMETSTARIAAMNAMAKQRATDGRPLSPEEEKELQEKKEASAKAYADAKTFVDNFRTQHNPQNKVVNNANAAANAAQQGGNGPQQQNSNENGQEAPVRPQLNPQQQASNTASNPALQSTQTVHAAIEAARIQQMGGGARPMQQNGQMTQGAQMPNQPAPSNMNMPQQQGQQIKSEGGPPQINTAVNQIQNQHRGSIGNTNSPQSAIPQSAGPQSATQQQAPRALSHSAALNQAARSYSSGQSAGPSVMGHSHPSAPAREAQNVITNKMPIPKHLPDRAVAQPQAVAMAPSRPTMSGGPSNGNSILSMPPIQQPPQTNNTTAGEHILSQGKLYELVRQVTGGGQGLEGGDILSPDVEAVSFLLFVLTCKANNHNKSIMDVADNFVDQVLEAACRNAKERGSKILEIRDIQLTLERGYNIRIPGYASDEIRTVRKMQPAPQWIAKMSAVTASKVTGGKNAD